MCKIICLSLIVYFLNLFTGFESFGQTNKVDTFKITQIVKKINDIKVVITQFKTLIESPDIPYCKAEIVIFRNNKKIDSIKYPEIDPVGSDYGLLVYNSLVNNHLIISKFGDYDGETIIINNKGEKFVTIGGRSFVDYDKGMLFSIYYSDLHGFNVFDLNTDREILKKIDIEQNPFEFYKDIYNRYFFTSINDDKKISTLWEIELSKNEIKQVIMDSKVIKYQKIKQLIDYKKIDVNCQ